MPLILRNANVVVTGGTGALGQAIVASLVEAGAMVHIPNFDPAELADFAFGDNSKVRVVEGVDLTDENTVVEFYAGLPPLWASIHVAGGFDMAPLADTTVGAFERQYRMNLLTAFLCCREAVAAMRRRSGAPGGRIVNIAARPALEARLGAGMVAYTAAKAGVAAMTVALGEELASDGIWVNAIAPSIIDTPSNRTAMPDASHDRWAAPDEIADAVCFLVSTENRAVRGGVIPVYGRT